MIDKIRTTKQTKEFMKKTLAGLLVGVFLFTNTLGWAQEERLFSTDTENMSFSSGPASNIKLSPPSRFDYEEFLEHSLAAATICKYIELDGNITDTSYLDDILARLKDWKKTSVTVLPYEIIIEIPNEGIAIRYFDPTKANIITPYTDVRKLSTKVIRPHLNRQIIHRTETLPTVGMVNGRAVDFLTDEERADQLNRDEESKEAYEELVQDTQRLAGVDAFICDFDGVDRVQIIGDRLSEKKKLLPDEVINATKNLSQRGVLKITLTGEQTDLFIDKAEGLERMATQCAQTLYHFLTRAGAIEQFIKKSGEVEKIPGYNEAHFKDNGVAQEILNITLEKLKEAVKDSEICQAEAERDQVKIEYYPKSQYLSIYVADERRVEKISVGVTTEGVSIEVGDDDRVQKIRFAIVGMIKEDDRIKKMQEDGRIPETTEIVASFGAVDITPTSKGASAIQMIKNKKLRRVILIADAVGTGDKPGNDRSMLCITQNDLHKAGITWPVDLIKIYVGSEEDAEIPDDVYIMPENYKKIAPSLDIYEAVIKAVQAVPDTRLLRHNMFLEGSSNLISMLLGDSEKNILLRIPVEILDFMDKTNVSRFFGAFQGNPNAYVELFYMSGIGEVSEEVYQKFGIRKKALPERFKRKRENTITLFPAFKGEELDQAKIRSRLGSFDITPTSTVLSPIGLQHDAAGLVRSTILGLGMMEIAREIEKSPDVLKNKDKYTEFKDRVQMKILEIYKNVCDPDANFNLTPEDVIALVTGDINEIVPALNKLIKLLPIAPIDAEELRQIFEHATKKFA